MLSRLIAILWAFVGKKICANSVQGKELVQKLCKQKSLAGICAKPVQNFGLFLRLAWPWRVRSAGKVNWMADGDKDTPAGDVARATRELFHGCGLGF